MWPWPRPTFAPSGILIHPAVWPQQTWTENWGGGCDPLGGGDLSPHLAQYGHGPGSLPKRDTALPIFGPCLPWLNGWIDEDATWYGSRPRPRPHCVRRGPSSPHERGTVVPPLFGPYTLWSRSPISATAELLFETWRRADETKRDVAEVGLASV